MVVTAELDQPLPAGVCPRDAQRDLNRLRAGTAENAHLRARNRSANNLGQLRLKRMARSVPKTPVELCPHCRKHGLWVVAKQHRPEAKRVVDVLFPVNVHEPCAMAILEADRNRFLERTKGSRDAAG